MTFAAGNVPFAEQQLDLFLTLLDFVVFVPVRCDKFLIVFNQQRFECLGVVRQRCSAQYQNFLALA
jgi:hypothetical protein